MMLNINNRNIIFIHIPKTAGTSILGSLVEDEHYKVTGHPFADQYSENDWLNSFCFGVIRNPFDRFISHWLYHTTNYDGNIFKKSNIEADNRTLEDYCDIVKVLSPHRPNWHTMTRFLDHPTGKCPDFLIRFESLESDWADINRILGISKKLLKLKSTPHLHYDNYYTKATKDFVREWYREDFINFDYEFEL